jgi:hypothetical protein
MITSMPHDRIHHGFQCRHVNIALPEGPGQDRIPDLLRAAAATIEEMETDGPIGVMDVLLHYDLEAGANRPHVTLYYYFPEEDEEL